MSLQERRDIFYVICMPEVVTHRPVKYLLVDVSIILHFVLNIKYLTTLERKLHYLDPKDFCFSCFHHCLGFMFVCLFVYCFPGRVCVLLFAACFGPFIILERHITAA